MDNPKAIVRRGYDMVSEAYRSDSFELAGTLYKKCLETLVPYLKPKSRILDLGCGCGIPIAKTLSGDYTLTGLDISAVQIRRARVLVPAAKFICADMTEYEFEPRSFAAIVSSYALIHVPLAEQPRLLERITNWLVEGGYLWITVGHKAWTGTEESWRGVDGATMYWSHGDRDTYEESLVGLGYRIIADIFRAEGSGGHNTFIAQKC